MTDFGIFQIDHRSSALWWMEAERIEPASICQVVEIVLDLVDVHVFFPEWELEAFIE